MTSPRRVVPSSVRRPALVVRRAFLSLTIAVAVATAAATIAPVSAAAAAAAAVAPGTPGSIQPELVAWHHAGNFAAVLAKAKKEKKHVFIDFYATWCGPCKMMDRQTYSDSTVAAAAAKYVARKVDAEKGEGIELSRRYGITAYPTMVLVDATGKELARAQGFRGPDEFARFLDDTREGRGTIEDIEKLIAAGQDTPQNRVALGEKYAERGDAGAARAQFDKAMALDSTDTGGRTAALLLYLAGHERAAGAHVEAVQDYERFLRLFPSSPRAPEAQAGMAVSLAETGRPDEAFAVYRTFAAGRPDDSQVQASMARFAAALKVGLDEGLAAGKRAVELSNGSANAYDALAEVHSARGEWDDAVAASEKALAARPSDNYLRGRLEKFQEGAAAAVRARNAGK